MKYPRTLHLPWSEGATSDDKILKDDSQFKGKYVVVTEKLDGENTSMHSNKVHARSVNQTKHASRNLIKALHASVKHGIPEGFQVVGENVYAKHSIPYLELTSYFYVFGVIDTKQDKFLSWDDTYRFVAPLGLQLVPVIYDGMYEDFVPPRLPFKSAFGDEAEGYVVRDIESFMVNDFQKCVAKCVRKDHVTTNKHWTNDWVPNILKPTV
jgi:hypothetical protein